MTPKQRINARDAQGRPIDVNFSGDPATQCPGCLGTDVEPFLAIRLVPVGDTGEKFAPVRCMRCLSCGARWMRAGV